MKPGLSVTADIITDRRENILALPLQALVLRDAESPDAVEEEPEAGTITNRRRASTVASRARDQEGVFVLEEGEVRFMAVETGIVGELEIEAISGVIEGQELITGPFKVLRVLKTGDQVAVEDRKSRRP